MIGAVKDSRFGFHRSLKEEEVWVHEYRSIEEARASRWTPHAEAENSWRPAGIAVASLPWPVHPMEWWRIG
jgi:hypothetical protein